MSDVERSATEAEREVLGAMLMSDKACWEAVEVLTGGDFSDPRHQQVFDAIAVLARDGKPHDAVAVSDHLLRTQAQGVPAEFVFTLTDHVIQVGHVGYVADTVKRYAGLRRAQEAAVVLQQGVTEGWDLFELTERAQALLEGVVPESTDVVTTADAMDYLIASLEQPPEYYATRWHHLNNYLHGLMPGGVYVVAARPGEGKTMMGLQMGVDLTKHGPVLYSSLEMPRDQLVRRLIAQEAAVSLTKLTRHTLEKDDWLKVAAARQKIRDMRLYIDDRSGVSITQIEAAARQAQRRAKGRLAGIVVDYLQLIPSRDSRKARWEHVGELTRTFKILAKTLRCPVILLCQLNRDSAKNRRLPDLHDLRESGSIEQDADAVLMLQRRRDDQTDDYTGELDVVIPKHRHGSTGRIELRWEGHFARLVSMPSWGATPTIDHQAMMLGEDA